MLFFNVESDRPQGINSRVMTRRQRVYIIGAGYIGSIHAAAAMKLPVSGRLEISGANRGQEVRERFHKQFPAGRVFDSAPRMLSEPAETNDIVVVATPPFSHAELVSLALESGRHVLSEKPLALNMDEAGSMLALAKEKGKYLGCCSTRFVGAPPSEEAKRLLREKALGDVYHVSFINRRQRNRAGIDDTPEVTWFLDPVKSGGGVLMDMAPYDFTALNNILEPVQVDVVSAWLVNPCPAGPPPTPECLEQNAGASLMYYLDNGRVVPVTYERIAYTQAEARTFMEIEGSRGAVRWDWFDLIGDGDVTFSRDVDNKVETERKRLGWGDIAYDERPLFYFHEFVHGKESPAVVNEQAVFNFACVRAVYDCAISGTKQSVYMT